MAVIGPIEWDTAHAIDRLASVAGCNLPPEGIEFARDRERLVIAYRATGSLDVILIECRVVREGRATLED